MLKNGLKRERDRNGWTQAETATRAGIPQSVYSMLETGRAAPEPGELDALCIALGVGERALYGEEILRAVLGRGAKEKQARKFFSVKIPGAFAPEVDAALAQGYANRTEFVVDAVRLRRKIIFYAMITRRHGRKADA